MRFKVELSQHAAASQVDRDRDQGGVPPLSERSQPEVATRPQAYQGVVWVP